MRKLKHRNTQAVVGTSAVILAGLYLSGPTPATAGATAAWTVVAAIRIKPTDDKTDVSTLDTREIQATGDDYDTAHAAIVTQVPEGWGPLYVRGE